MSRAEPAELRERLAAGPQRGLGCAAEVAREALADGDALRALVAALEDERTTVVARAANALKRVQAADPRILDPFGTRLVRKALNCDVLEARWNLAIVIGGLQLSAHQRALAVELMFEALASSSAFLRVFAMQALVDISQADPKLRDRVRVVVSRALEDPAAAVRARARKLWASLVI